MRPVNASTGYALSQCFEMMPGLSSPVYPMANGVASSLRNGGSLQKRVNTLTPPPLQLNGGSSLKTTLSGRDMEMELRLRGFNNVEETFGSYVSSPSRMGKNMNQHRKQPPHYEFDSSAAAVAKRSLSFKPAVQASSPSNLSDWGSPSEKLEWGLQGDEMNKMRRSVSFGIHNNEGRDYRNEPDVLWVNSLVKDSVVLERGFGLNERVRIMSLG